MNSTQAVCLPSLDILDLTGNDLCRSPLAKPSRALSTWSPKGHKQANLRLTRRPSMAFRPAELIPGWEGDEGRALVYRYLCLHSRLTVKKTGFSR